MPNRVFAGTVSRNNGNAHQGAIKVDMTMWNFRIYSQPISAGRLLYGPTKDCDYGFLDPGASRFISGHWPELFIKTAWSSAEVVVWEDAGFETHTPQPSNGTSFKGGPPLVLAPDGTVTQISTTVIGTDRITLAQDPRNDPNTLIWVSTHVNLLPSQKDPNGKPLPGSGPPGQDGVHKQFPLLYGQYLEVEDFNSALWGWMEPGQDVGTARIYFAKYEFGH